MMAKILHDKDADLSALEGKTVAVIGTHNNVIVTKRAITNLILGSRHGNVYAFIEKEMKSIK